MVYTVTFNPAIDYVVRMDDLKLGEVNRASYEAMFFGGKGINVSIVLNELGIKSRTLGFTAGFTGEAIENGLRSMGIDADFVRLEKGNSRINVKIKANEETEINGQGPHIDDNALAALFEKLDNLKDGDTLILAGSIFLIKPNNHELGEMFGIKLSTIEEIEEYARKLQEKGARNVLISMAGDGALLVDENGKTHISGVCKGVVKNSVGAGDSMVAGFVAGSLDGDYEYALKLGTAAGGATAFSDGLATKEKITELLNTL